MKKQKQNKTGGTTAVSAHSSPPVAPQITPDQINGRIASLESELAQLQNEQNSDAESHKNIVSGFQARFGARVKKHNELTGSITALRALLT